MQEIFKFFILIHLFKTLFGLINTNERYSRNSTGQAITNDVHNLLLLSNNTQRFELLPVANIMSSSMQANINNISNAAISAQNSLIQTSVGVIIISKFK